MKKSWFWFVLVLCPLCPASGKVPRPHSSRVNEPHRSPMDVVIFPDGRRALTANHTADSASLVDLASGRVLAEVPCGRKPAGVACSADGRRAAVSNLWAGTLTLLEVNDTAARPAGTVRVGAGPRGVVFAPDGDSLYVALSGAGEVVQINWPDGKVLRRWPAPAEPRRLALSRDGRRLAAVSTRSAQVRCWDTASGKELWERKLHDAFSSLGLTFGPGDKELIVPHAHDRHHAIARHNIEQGWAIDNRLSRLPVEAAGGDREQLALDLRALAAGDPSAVAYDAKGAWFAVAAAGTGELLLFQAATVPWNAGDPGDFLDPLLDRDDGKFRRVGLGGRPLAVQFAGETAVVANYLLDAVQVVDAKTGHLVRQVALGGPAKLSLERRGEAIFYDAKRSHHQWFSCHTCHPDGHTCGRTFDTLNDDSYGNAKLTPTLRGAGRTGPFTWHGWQKDLGDAVEKSLTETLFGPKPAADDVKAVVAFLATLNHPPNPRRRPDGSLNPAAERGLVLFHEKGRCARCHHGDEFTAAGNYDVKLEGDGSPFALWNPPSLRGLYDRGPYLHDGRAESLEEVLQFLHAPERLGGQALTLEERKDLVEFLKSL